MFMAHATADGVKFEIRVVTQVPERRTRQQEYTVTKVVNEKTADGKTVQRRVPEIRQRTVTYTTLVPTTTIHTKAYAIEKIAAISTDMKRVGAADLKKQLAKRRPVMVLFSDYDLAPEFVRLFGPGQLILTVNEKRAEFMGHQHTAPAQVGAIGRIPAQGVQAQGVQARAAKVQALNRARRAVQPLPAQQFLPLPNFIPANVQPARPKR